MNKRTQWYVVTSESGFQTLISATSAKEARKLYSEVYIGGVVAAKRDHCKRRHGV